MATSKRGKVLVRFAEPFNHNYVRTDLAPGENSTPE
jgi:hypothetical protein